jgi:hypothetical protein
VFLPHTTHKPQYHSLRGSSRRHYPITDDKDTYS